MKPSDNQPQRLPAEDAHPASDQRPARHIIVRQISAAPDADVPGQERRGGTNYLGLGCLVMAIGIVVVVVVLVLALAAGVINLTALPASLFSGLTGALDTRPEASVVSTQAIVTNIQEMGQLVTTGVQLAKADIRVNVRQGLLDACSYAASYVAQGTIEAGIDLTQFGIADVQYDAVTDTYTITLPPPQLTSCRVEFIDQYDESLTLCVADWDAARQLGQYIALNEFRDEALEGGILSRTEQQAQRVFGNVVRALTGSSSQINIVFSGDPVPLPASCQPEPPGGWTYDSTTQTWTRPE